MATTSWATLLEEHAKICTNCTCGQEMEEVLGGLTEDSEIFAALADWAGAQEEERRIKVRRAEKRYTPRNSTPSETGSPLFQATWAGRCKECGDHFKRWDSIGYVAGKAGPLCRTCHETHDDYTPYGY